MLFKCISAFLHKTVFFVKVRSLSKTETKLLKNGFSASISALTEMSGESSGVEIFPGASVQQPVRRCQGQKEWEEEGHRAVGGMVPGVTGAPGHDLPTYKHILKIIK